MRTKTRFAAARVGGPLHLALALLVAAMVLLPAAALLPAPALAQTGTAGTVADSIPRLNVRSGPGTTFAIVGKLPAGSAVTILGADDSGAWLQVSAAELSEPGWVAADFVEQGGAPAAASPAPTRAGSALAGAGRGALAATPTAAAPALVLPTPTPKAAAVSAPAVAPTAAQTVAPTAAPTAAPTLAPTAAPTAAPAAAEPTATPLPALDVSEPTAVVVPTTMNVRGGPGTNYPRVGGVSGGTRLAITGVNPAGDWYRVTLPGSEQEGWVFGGLVTTAGPMEQVTALSEADLPAPPAPAAASASVAGAPAPSGGGGFGYGITANMWQSDKAGVANAVADLGFGWVKQQVRWEFVETAPGAVNWQEMDDIVNTMNGYGINVAFSIVTAPAWTRPNLGGTNGPPEDFQLFANFLGVVAGRYCGQSLKAIEVWNEQNLRREWEGFALEPALYMELLKRSYASIKAACPSMIVISGATTPAGYSDVAFDDIDYLRGMYQNGLARYSDGVGIHPSGFANPPGVRFRDWESGQYNAESHVNHRSFYFLSTLEESRAVMEQFGDGGKRLWPTEFGWGSSLTPHPGYEYQARISEQQQADWVAEAFRIMANSGYVGVAFLWNLNYNYGEMQTFAVMGRPAYQALKSVTGR